MPPYIWDSIAAARSLQPASEVRNFFGGRANPCLTCEGSPCCSYLPLHSIEPTTYLELDGLYKMLLFERVELGLSSSGTWSVYYTYACRFLERDQYMCGIHDTELQPKTCVYYKPYGCWYRRVLTGPAEEDYLRVDLPRFRRIVELYRFDDNRRIVQTPPWEQVQQVCAEELERETATLADTAPSPDVAIWDLALEPTPAPALPEAGGFLDVLGDPCRACPSPCCHYLCIPNSPSETFMSLDFNRFALGFPGVELGISDTTWWLMLQSRCRYYDAEAGGCGVYGQPERPLACTYFNQWSCTYRHEFTQALPEGFVRLRYEHFPVLAALMQFDERGRVTRHPSVDELQQALVGYWRELIAQGDPSTSPDERPIVDALAPQPGSEAHRLATGE